MSTPFSIKNTDDSLTISLSKNNTRRNEAKIWYAIVSAIIPIILWFAYSSGNRTVPMIYIFAIYGPIWLLLSYGMLWDYFVKCAPQTITISPGLIVHVSHTPFGNLKSETNFRSINTIEIEEIQFRGGINRFIAITYDTRKRIRLAENYDFPTLQKLLNELQIAMESHFRLH